MGFEWENSQIQTLIAQFEHAQIAMLLFDENFLVQYANSYLRTNYPVLASRDSLSAVFPAPDRRKMIETLRTNRHMIVSCEAMELKHAALSLSQITNPEGNTCAVLGLLTLARESYGSVQELLSDGGVVFSEAFRDPLANLFGSLNVINQKTSLGRVQGVDPYLLSAVRSGYAMLHNVNNLSRRIQNFSTFHKAPEPVWFWAQTGEVLEACKMLLLQSKIAFSYDIPSEERIVSCVFEDISQALMNLISNACRAYRQNGRQPSFVKVTGSNSSGSVIITVEDNGLGMTEQEQQRAFEPYYTKPRHDCEQSLGLGLGLPAARQIIRGSGGGLVLQSSPEAGTKAAFHLPVITGPLPKTRSPLESGAAQYVHDRFSPVFMGLYDFIDLPT